jgi:hypothetical protein
MVLVLVMVEVEVMVVVAMATLPSDLGPPTPISDRRPKKYPHLAAKSVDVGIFSKIGASSTVS